MRHFRFLLPGLSDWRLILLILAGATNSPLLGTPPADPICGAPNSLERVQKVRLQLSLQRKAASFIGQQAELLPRLTIERTESREFPKLVFFGAADQTYDLEATPTLTGQWNSLLTFRLGGTQLNWNEESLGQSSLQFYRLRSGDPNALAASASNFRLLDHQGVSRDLYYHDHLAAIVLLTATNIDEVVPVLPVLNDIKRLYTNRVETWILLSDQNAIRSNVVSQAKRLNVTSPIVLDSNGLAARSAGLTRAGEVAVIQPPAFTVAYRGAIRSSGESTFEESYLGQALNSVMVDQALVFPRITSKGVVLPHMTAGEPNYSTDIAPILHKYCANCHRPGGVAPFAMTNHAVVAAYSAGIKHKLVSNLMPPWHADPEYGNFTNNLSLPGDLRARLVSWIDAGAPRGGGSDPLSELPLPPDFSAWPSDLGEPDAIVTIPSQPIKASGVEAYRYIPVQTPNTTNVWLRAAIIRPSNYRSVHHYLVFLGIKTGYDAHIAEFVPGYKPLRYPVDSGVFLTKSNWLTFNLHYQPYGIATNDQPVLALWYHRTPPVKAWKMKDVSNSGFVIPAGARDYQTQSEWITPNTVTVHRLNPHMHLRGKRMKFDVVYPSGARETLLSVPDYDFGWQIGYDLAQPKMLPAGSRVVVSGAFDNSPQNLANPNPAAIVHFGEQSSEEMFIGYVDYTQ